MHTTILWRWRAAAVAILLLLVTACGGEGDSGGIPPIFTPPPSQSPGDDGEQPGGNDQQPGGDDQQPGGDDQQPGRSATPTRPGQPQFELIRTKDTGADIKVAWEAPDNGAAASYRYRGGVNEGSRWSIDASTERNEVVLTDVPLNGSYWICVTGVNAAGEEGPQACNSVTTPVSSGGGGNDTPPPPPPVTGVPVNECASPKPEWIWCDDFEQDRRSAYFESTMALRNGVGRNGSRAAVGRYLIGSREAGNFKVAFGRTPSASFRPVDGGTRNYRDVYWRVFVKLPENWQGGGADKLSRAMVFSGSNWSQAMIAHVWSGTDPGPNQNYLMIDPATGVDASGRLVTTSYNDFNNLRWLGARRGSTPLFEPARRGQWQCVEARVRLNDAGQANGIFELWVNDKLDVRRTDLNWVGSYNAYGINAVFLENYWNAGTPVEQERYLDNFVISTARIGCGT